MKAGARALSAFPDDRQGSIAIIFALSLFMLATAVGLAIDLGRAYNTRVQLQNALDAAVLAAAKRLMTVGGDAAAMDEAVRKFFAADQPTRHFADIVTVKVTNVGSDFVNAEAIAKVPTTFMHLAGFQNVEIYTSAQASFGLGNAEIALVLDTTASMAGAKLSDLKASAKNLVDIVYSNSEAENRVKFALVPFAQYVNVGLGNRNAPWMNVPLDYTETKYQCSTVTPIIGRSNCRMETRTGYNDGVPYTYEAEVCDYEYGPPEEQCGDNNYSYTWRGCAGSRDYPLNTQYADYSRRIPGVMNDSCPSEIAPLSSDQDSIRASIDSMTAVGDTYVPSGLAWGWRALSKAEPFSEGADASSSSKVRKYLVLMTDGANTRSTRNLSTNVNDHWGSDVANANKITTELCTNIKAAGIEIFAIAFEVTDTDIKDILRGCASAGFYDAADSSQLSAAFKDIAGNLAELHISK
ncbi:MAG: hypothetical protein RLZ98_1942 [Pseudomonadota bacterium]|jgi:Flp pilus assembly protein TadG